MYYVNYNIPFADAHSVVLMEGITLEEMVSFDRELDRILAMRRVEP